MGRILAMALVIYGYGDRGFDGHRPEALDRPLHGFHRAVDITALQAQQILVTLDNSAGSVATLAQLGDRLRKAGDALVSAVGR